MHFLQVNARFHEAVNVIHDVITTADPIPYTAKFMFGGVRYNKHSESIAWQYQVPYRLHVFLEV